MYKLIYFLFFFLFSIFLASCEAFTFTDPVIADGESETAETEKNTDPELIVKKQIEKTEPETSTAEETEPYIPVYGINPKFDELLKINGDIVGEIKIEGTIIDFPVLYSGDNEYYLKRDIYKNDTKYGSIFMEMMNRGAILDRNTILHGHNFEGNDNNMFAELEKFKDEEFFTGHKNIIFNNLYSDMEWEVFSVYTVSAEDYYLITRFGTEQEYIDFAKFVKSRSLFFSGYEPQAGDYMLTLHTCSYEFKNAHTLVHARLVKKTDNLK